MDLNKAMIIGRLTRDPENRTTPQGTPVASFSVATSFVWTDGSGQKQKRAEYHNIVAWRKLAEICSQYLHKGSHVYIEGRLQTRSWDDQQSGTKKYRTEIIADNMIMLDPKGAGEGYNQGGAYPSENSAPASQPSEEEISVEEIPF